MNWPAESLDTGEPLWLSSSVDIPRAAYNFTFRSIIAFHLGTEAYEMDNVALNYARRPVGVVGSINPWNLPLLLMTWKLAPCLCRAVNTAIMKPAKLIHLTATVLWFKLSGGGSARRCG